MNKLQSLAINDNGFAFDPLTGESYTLNPVACRILNLLKQGKALDKVAQVLAKEFDKEFTEMYTDVLDFRHQLNIYGLCGAQDD